MAFECSLSFKSVNKSEDALRSKEGSIHCVGSYTDCLTVTPGCIDKGNKQPVILKSIPKSKGLHQKRAIAVSDSVGVYKPPSNGKRSIMDLPAALVYEILHRLDAKDLGVVSCVSTALNNLTSNHQGWKDFYCRRWGLPQNLSTRSNSPCLPDESREKSWKELFVERELRSKVFMGRYSVDMLNGHSEAVRSVFVLLSANVIITGGYDSVVRIWDLEDGLCVAESRPLGCTIRAIAADTQLLVVGGTDAFIQCWRAIEGNPFLFDITGSVTKINSALRLWGHEGPITCLALDSARMFSGSWDMTLRVWDRAELKCLHILRHADWVWALVPCGLTVATTSGSDAFIWDIESGNQIEVIRSAHAGNAYALARSYSGDLLFTGGEDGVIHMYEVLAKYEYGNLKPVATWIPHSAAVNSIAFEFPWLVSSSSDGRLALIDVRKLLKCNESSNSRLRCNAKQPSQTIEPPQRMLHGSGCSIFSVAVGSDRIVCGGDEGMVRVWNFSQALEVEKRIQALRRVRLENRMRRRKAQDEMNVKGRTEQSSVGAKTGDRNGIWYSKRGLARNL